MTNTKFPLYWAIMKQWWPAAQTTVYGTVEKWEVTSSRNKFLVFFLGVEITEMIRLKNVYHCLSPFARVPKQVFGVYLNGVDHKHSRTKKGLRMVDDSAQNKNLTLKFISVWPNICVDLFDALGPTEIDIAKELIASKAVKVESETNKIIWSKFQYVPKFTFMLLMVLLSLVNLAQRIICVFFFQRQTQSNGKLIGNYFRKSVTSFPIQLFRITLIFNRMHCIF